MENAIFRLKQGVTLTERDGHVGVSLAGHTRFAKDEWQAILLRTLIEQAQSLESLTAILYTRNGSSLDEATDALELADFILGFDYYLES